MSHSQYLGLGFGHIFLGATIQPTTHTNGLMTSDTQIMCPDYWFQSYTPYRNRRSEISLSTAGIL